MLLFAVFENDLPAKQWPLRHAHLLGADEIVIPGEVRFDRGLIRCERRAEGAAGLALQYPVDSGAEGGPPALVVLRTALLPQRTLPYLLSLELARHRLMFILNKLEEWAFFDLPADDPISKLVEETRQATTWAMLLAKGGSGPHGEWYSPEADHAARQALAVGLQAGELIARRQADVQHTRRITGELARYASMPLPHNAITDHEARASREASIGSPGVILPEMPKVGCSVNPALATPELQAQIAQSCDFVAMPMRWVDMEPVEGKYTFKPTDAWVEWAVTKAKLPVTAGPLIDLRPGNIPDFLYIWEHDYETLRDVIIEHVKALVTRYRRAVGTWNVCSGLQSGSAFVLSPEQIVDLTRTCVLLVKKLQPSARVIAEIAQPWGEYGGLPGNTTRSIPPATYAELMNQLGLEIDALGLRIQMGHNEPGRATRDVLAISHLLDRFAACDRPVSITALGVPSRPPAPPAAGGVTDAVPPDPGYWHGPWSPQIQSEWLRMVGAMALGKPFVQSICWQDLYDADAGAEMPGGGLTTLGGGPKPGMRVLADLRAAVREKRPHLG
ncbi:MAG: endo-1,4-beta-xylanase [Phycisphaerales bacterium]